MAKGIVGKSRIGACRKLSDGHTATIIDYLGPDLYLVEISTGDRRKMMWDQFNNLRSSKKHIHDKQCRIGEVVKQNCGYNAEIIAYRNSKDIDVRFEDGTIVKKRTYRDFCNKEIQHPLCRKKEKIGERYKQKNDLTAVIIGYRSNHEVDIVIEETGEKVKNVRYDRLKKGTLSFKKIRKFSDLVESEFADKLGIPFIITDIHRYNDVTVTYIDSTMVFNQRVNRIEKGTVVHPAFNKHYPEVKTFFFYEILGKSFHLNDGRVYYKVKNIKTNEFDIMTPQEMMEAASSISHNCQGGGYT